MILRVRRTQTTRFRKWGNDLSRYLTKDLQMANNHMRKCSPYHTSLGNCKLKRYLLDSYSNAHLLGWPESKTLTTPNAAEDVGQQELVRPLGGGGWKMPQPPWKTVWKFPTKLKTPMRLGTYPNELKTYVRAKTCTQMFTEAVNIITKTRKQPT